MYTICKVIGKSSCTMYKVINMKSHGYNVFRENKLTGFSL